MGYATAEVPVSVRVTCFFSSSKIVVSDVRHTDPNRWVHVSLGELVVITIES